MKKNIQRKTNEFFEKFKNEIKNKNDVSKDELIQFIFDYPTIKFQNEDFKKRKRVKNTIPLCNRCTAIKSSNTQCTRRKKEGFEFCGTHIKGTPHGVINNTVESKVKYINTFSVHINGIVNFIDDDLNVYDPVDIFENNKNPKIISKCIKNKNEDGDDTYSLVDY